MIKRFLIMSALAILAAVNPTAEINPVVTAPLIAQEKITSSFCFFENGLPFRADVNPKKIGVIAPLIPFFEHVAKTLTQPLAIDFVDASSQPISFTPAQKEMPALLFITKESLEKIPSAELEKLCAETIARALTPQPILTWIEKFLTCSNNTAKVFLFLHLAKIGIISINNKTFTTTDKDGSSLLAWGAGTTVSWMGIKALQKLVEQIKEKSIKQKSLIFLRKALPAVPLH